MASPPRMLLLSGGGTEAFVLMPVTYDVSLLKSLRDADTADIVESLSGGSGEIPNSKRYSYYSVKL